MDRLPFVGTRNGALTSPSGGDDFYGWFLGPRMIYTSGIVGSLEEEESLEKLQDNKLTVVCEKVCLLHFRCELKW